MFFFSTMDPVTINSARYVNKVYEMHLDVLRRKTNKDQHIYITMTIGG